jgi:hypothetical protein
MWRIMAKDCAKVQIGAELLCKGAKVFLGLEPGLGLGLENFPGLGSQPSGARFRSSGSGTGSGFEFARYPYLHLKTRTRDLMAET